MVYISFLTLLHRKEIFFLCKLFVYVVPVVICFQFEFLSSFVSVVIDQSSKLNLVLVVLPEKWPSLRFKNLIFNMVLQRKKKQFNADNGNINAKSLLQAVSMGELYGEINKLTMEWRDGLMAITVRVCVQVSNYR